jgi:hypothetical protein
MPLTAITRAVNGVTVTVNGALTECKRIPKQHLKWARYEKQEAQNYERYISKRLAEARTKANPRFRDEQFLYAEK